MDDEALAICRAAADHIDRHELAQAHRLLAPLTDRRDLAPATTGRILLEWAWLLGAQQRNGEAAAAFQRVIELAGSAGLPQLLSEALLEAGILARYDGRYDDAERLLTEAAAGAAADGDWLRVGQTLAQRASVAHQRYRFGDALDRLAELSAVLDQCPPSPQTDKLRADLCHQRAVNARVSRDFDLSRALIGEARDRYAALGRRIGVANAERELGAVLEQVGDDEGARAAYGRAFTGYLRAGRTLGAAHVARRLGQMRLLNVPEEPAAAAYARRRFTQALRLGKGEPGNRGLCELFLARLDRLSGDLEAAEARLAALPYDEGLDAPRDLSQAALEWGMLSRARGDRTAAIGFFGQALLPLDEDVDPSAASIAHYQLAYDLILDDQVEAAKKHAVAAFTLNERAGRRLRDPAHRTSFYRSERQSYILAMHCAARADDGATAFTVATAARAEALSDFIRSGAQFSPQVRDLVAKITLARDTPAHLSELHRRLEQLTTAELRRSVTPQPATLDETRAALPPGGHALLIDVLEDEDTICNRVWLTPDGAVHVDEVVLTDGVRRWLDRYHAAEPRHASAVQDDQLTELGTAVIPDRLAEILAGEAVPPLIVSTGGLLGPVPVAAIRTGSRYLAELARIVVVPAVTLWTSIRSRPPRPGNGVAAYLDTNLPGTRRERSHLKQALPHTRFLERDEVRPLLADAADLSAVLLSVHGTAETGLGQALMLGPHDPLAAAEMLTCRLPEAVLMPACWAGRIDQRAAAEPLGLPTAALLAGARWVLAGTMDIATVTTATLLGVFYQGLAAGRAPVDALRDAQLGYLRRRTTVGPGLWAGLSIVGDGFTPIQPSPTAQPPLHSRYPIR